MSEILFEVREDEVDGGYTAAEVVPNHHPIKTGTLSSILKRIAAHHGLTMKDF